MTRYLVLVDAPVNEGPTLAEFERLATDPETTFHVVVPVSDLDDVERSFVELEEAPAETADSAEVVAARWRLRDAVTTFEKAGLTATGIVGATSPVDSIEQALEADSFDAVVVVTGPAGIAGWVNLDLASRLERHLSEPVVTIEVEPPSDSA